MSKERINDIKIITLTSGLDPKQLTDRQRKVAADARLREAARLEAERR